MVKEGYNNWEKENYFPKTAKRMKRDVITKKKKDANIDCFWTVDDSSDYEEDSSLIEDL